MFLIKSLVRLPEYGIWLYGNKSYTDDLKYARRFETYESAVSHVNSWFIPSECLIVSEANAFNS